MLVYCDTVAVMLNKFMDSNEKAVAHASRTLIVVERIIIKSQKNR